MLDKIVSVFVARIFDEFNNKLKRGTNELNASVIVRNRGRRLADGIKWQLTQAARLGFKILDEIGHMIQYPVAPAQCVRYGTGFTEWGDEFVTDARRIAAKLDENAIVRVSEFGGPFGDVKGERQVLTTPR
jgi:hypothetical protein